MRLPRDAQNVRHPFHHGWCRVGASMGTAEDDVWVRRWLWLVYAMVLLMVAVGGTTRLTGSGLSMVEWRPLMGALPPLGESEWARVFDLYQRSPQYQQVNDWMTLGDFKRIFFWEYLHRLIGRVIGVVVLVPWVYFVARRRMSRRVRRWTFMALVFGGLQGLLGWFMVKSGLVDVPAVSHLRLAAHLLLAFFVAMWVLWLILELRAAGRSEGAPPRHLLAPARAFLGLVVVQVAWGAFMAGKRAGLLFSTFPDMNGVLGPGPFRGADPILVDLVHNPALIHWTHRTLAYVVAVAAAALCQAVFRHTLPGTAARRAAMHVAGLVASQVVLGVLTVVWHVPTGVAVAHQVVAFLLVSACVALVHALGRQPNP